MGGVSHAMKSRRTSDGRVPRARQLRRDMTEAERRLWQRLRQLAGKAHFRRQATIGPYFADFACHTSRLAIELDGGQHGLDSHVARDRLRQAYLEAQGYRALRFWNNDVMQNIDGVLFVGAEALGDLAKPAIAATPPTPDPSPPLRGGRGGPDRP